MIYFDSDMSKSTNTVAGADPGGGGGRTRAPPPLKLEKI